MRYIERINFKQKPSKYSFKKTLFKDELMNVLKIHNLEYLYSVLENPPLDFSIFYFSLFDNYEIRLEYYSPLFHISRINKPIENNVVEVFEFIKYKKHDEIIKLKKYAINGIEYGIIDCDIDGCYMSVAFENHGYSRIDNKICFFFNNTKLL